MSEPDWRSALLASVADRPGRYNREHNSGVRRRTDRILPGRQELLQVRMTEPFMRTIRAAAKAREVTVAGWVRRVLAVSASVDTGANLRGLLGEVPRALPYATRGGYRVQGTDAGADLGTWCPHPGCDGAHLL